MADHPPSLNRGTMDGGQVIASPSMISFPYFRISAYTPFTRSPIFPYTLTPFPAYPLLPLRPRQSVAFHKSTSRKEKCATSTELQLLSYPISASTPLTYSIVSVRTAFKSAFAGVVPSSTIPRKVILKSSRVINGMYTVM